MKATRLRFLGWHCVLTRPALPLERNPRRLRLYTVIVIGVIVAVCAATGVAPAITLLSISGVIGAAAAVCRFVLQGAAPAASPA
jgi:hypothetical protein